MPSGMQNPAFLIPAIRQELRGEGTVSSGDVPRLLGFPVYLRVDCWGLFGYWVRRQGRQKQKAKSNETQGSEWSGGAIPIVSSTRIALYLGSITITVLQVRCATVGKRGRGIRKRRHHIREAVPHTQLSLTSLLSPPPSPCKHYMFPLANSLRTTTTRSLAAATSSTQRFFSNTAIAMGVTKTVSQEGSGPSPKVGDKVTIDYTGYLKDTSAPDNKGKKCAPLPLSCLDPD